VPEQRVAIVTGAGSGIGRSCALDLAGRGFAVVVSDVDTDGGEESVKLVEKEGGTASFRRADCSSPEESEALVSFATDTYGRLDAAVNNAGIGGEAATTGEYPIDSWKKVIDVNLSGVFYGMRYQIPAMIDGGGGRIVNMASILGSVGFATACAYVSAKHGVVGLTKTAAQEYASAGILVNAVGPGFIETPLLENADLDDATRAMLVQLHPIGRLGQPEEVAALVGWLCDESPDFLTGDYLPIDGGYLTR
jgi:NAD(P)-dependent dehydrogenase (short-subunit alcohol dehydrogenase family)